MVSGILFVVTMCNPKKVDRVARQSYRDPAIRTRTDAWTRSCSRYTTRSCVYRETLVEILSFFEALGRLTASVYTDCCHVGVNAVLVRSYTLSCGIRRVSLLMSTSLESCVQLAKGSNRPYHITSYMPECVFLNHLEHFLGLFAYENLMPT
jgi:hypothetical protein